MVYTNFGIEPQDYANNCSAARDIVYNAGNLIIQIFGDGYGDIAVSCWKLGVIQHNTLNTVFTNKQVNADIIKQYNDKISMFDSSYQAPQTNLKVPENNREAKGINNFVNVIWIFTGILTFIFTIMCFAYFNS